jgi:hypothetical protein
VQRGDEAPSPELCPSPSLGYSANLEGTPPRHRARARAGEVATGARLGEALRRRHRRRSASPLEDVGAAPPRPAIGLSLLNDAGKSRRGHRACDPPTAAGDVLLEAAGHGSAERSLPVGPSS